MGCLLCVAECGGCCSRGVVWEKRGWWGRGCRRAGPAVCAYLACCGDGDVCGGGGGVWCGCAMHAPTPAAVARAVQH
eukprot:scaffold173939_cov17-Tisochrysis_lutea.AAC.1